MENKYTNLLCYLSWAFSYPFTKPDTLQIDITHRCNLDCRMCNIKQYPAKESDEISKDEIIGLLAQAKEMGIKNLVFAGGEPLLRKDTFEICAYAKEIGIYPVIVSNGTLIDNDCIKDMVQKFRGTISISLDGMEEKHDYLRGEGSFKKTVEGIKRIVDIQKIRKEKHIFLQIGLVITKSNYKDLTSVVNLAKKLEVDGVYFIPLMRDNTNLNDTSNKHYLWLTKGEIDELKIILEEATKIAQEKGINLEAKITNDLLIKYYRGEISNRQWVCYGGFKNIFITLCNPEKKEYYQPYVRICMEFLGNIRKERLSDIWFSKSAFKARRRMKYCKAPCMQPCFPGRTLNRYQALLNSACSFLGF